MVNRLREDPAVAEAVLDWFIARRAEYLTWRPAESYAGRGFSDGSFSVNEQVVRGQLPHALKHYDHHHGPPPIPPGPVDVEAALRDLDAPSRRAASEPYAGRMLDEEGQRRLQPVPHPGEPAPDVRVLRPGVQHEPAAPSHLQRLQGGREAEMHDLWSGVPPAAPAGEAMLTVR
jgi:hypothetical protein